MLHQIGAGALGPVFRAYEPELDKLVAVKVLQLDLPPDRVHRLVAELERLIAADLTHPGIAALLAAGLSGNHAYLAQDFIGADALDVAVREHNLPPVSDIIRIVVQVSSALDSAAGAGVFHGALHPRDVLVSTDDVRVTGLGIVQALERVDATAQVRRPYTAPERAAGHAWDRRADVFGLAAIAYELIAARRPSGVGREAAEGLPPVPGADRDQLSRVFVRALAEDPDERFDSAGAFAEGLRFALRGASKSKRKGDVEPRAREVEVRTPEVEPRLREVEPRLREVEPRLPLEAPALVDLPLASPLVQQAQSSIDPLSERTIVMAAATDTPEPVPPPEPPVAVAVPAVEEKQPEEVVIQAASMPDSRSRFVRNRARGRLVTPDVVSTPVPTAPAPTPRASTPDVPTPILPVPSVSPSVTPPSISLSSLSTTTAQTAIWPIGLAALVGVAVGFALGQVIPLRSSGTFDSAATVATESDIAPAVSVPPGNLPPLPDVPMAAAGAPPVINEPVPALEPAAPSPAAAPAREATVVREPALIASAPPPPAVVEGRIVIRSTPPGARVSVNGRGEGQTPTTLRGLNAGTYTVRVTRDGFAAQERRVVISAAQPSPTVNVTLAPVKPPATAAPVAPAARGALRVESRPEGARVTIDGRPAGTTPLDLSEIAPGEHVIRIERDGYQGWSDTVRVVAGERLRVAASLEPQRQ